MPRTFTHGWNRQAKDDRDYQFRPAARLLAALPTVADLSAKMGPLLDQGSLGSCGPNSAAECISYDQGAENLPVVTPSRLFVYYNTRALMGTINQDSGVDNRSMLKALAGQGFCPEIDDPYSVATFTQKPSAKAYADALPNRAINYAAVPQTPADMKAAIAGGHTFIFGFDVYESMLSDAVATSGVVPMPAAGASPVGGHDVTFCGFDDSRSLFKFRNHWTNSDGSPWGDKGYGYMPYAYAFNWNLAGDFWVINAIPGQIVVPPAPTPPVPPAPPLPTPPGNIKQQIDAVFDALILQNARSWYTVALLKMVKQMVDNFLTTHPVAFHATVSPAALIPLVDQVFVLVEQQWPAWAQWLALANSMIDGYLAAQPT